MKKHTFEFTPATVRLENETFLIHPSALSHADKTARAFADRCYDKHAERFNGGPSWGAIYYRHWYGIVCKLGEPVGLHAKQDDPVFNNSVEYDDNLFYEPANGFNPDQVQGMDPAATLRYNELEYMYWGHDDIFPVDMLLEF